MSQLCISPLPSSRHHLSNDDRLKIRGKIIRTVLCSVVYTTVHNDAHTYEQFLKMSAGLGLGLVFVRVFGFSFLCFFSVLA